jgi:hypothetical protein
MYSTPSTAQEIENTIHSLKAKGSGGYEEISMWILKLSSSFITSFHSCTVHLDTIESFNYPTDAQLDCFKMLKFT